MPQRQWIGPFLLVLQPPGSREDRERARFVEGIPGFCGIDMAFAFDPRTVQKTGI